MNDSHWHVDPSSGIEVDTLGTRADCPICQQLRHPKETAAKKSPPKAE